VKTKVIEADFTSGEIYPKVKEDLEGLDIGVLVNNVGISYPHPEYFLELENKERIYSDMVQCNVMSVLSMCQIVMPGMVKRKKGIVINISSGLGAIPAPQLAVYGATKVYLFISHF
jgi:17beta-estradiol 17-dehydrogenase / very-long-chain 3-oxoacyl-CoA reductase